MTEAIWSPAFHMVLQILPEVVTNYRVTLQSSDPWTSLGMTPTLSYCFFSLEHYKFTLTLFSLEKDAKNNNTPYASAPEGINLLLFFQGV